MLASFKTLTKLVIFGLCFPGITPLAPLCWLYFMSGHAMDTKLTTHTFMLVDFRATLLLKERNFCGLVSD